MIEKLTKNEDGGFLDKEGCWWETEAEYLQTSILGLCGCGNPDDIMLYIKEMLERLEKQDHGEYEDKPYMFFAYWANKKGFAEHGSTARCSWLTDKGKELLKDINTLISKDQEVTENE